MKTLQQQKDEIDKEALRAKAKLTKLHLTKGKLLQSLKLKILILR